LSLHRKIVVPEYYVQIGKLLATFTGLLATSFIGHLSSTVMNHSFSAL